MANPEKDPTESTVRNAVKRGLDGLMAKQVIGRKAHRFRRFSRRRAAGDAVEWRPRRRRPGLMDPWPLRYRRRPLSGLA